MRLVTLLQGELLLLVNAGAGRRVETLGLVSAGGSCGAELLLLADTNGCVTACSFSGEVCLSCVSTTGETFEPVVTGPAPVCKAAPSSTSCCVAVSLSSSSDSSVNGNALRSWFWFRSPPSF
jgi:hypothetical protein